MSLTACAAGLLIGLVYSLVKIRVREPIVFALIGFAVMLLGPITTYVYPFGVGLLLGLAYDTLEEEWYGSAVADSARASYRLRLFLKKRRTAQTAAGAAQRRVIKKSPFERGLVRAGTPHLWALLYRSKQRVPDVAARGAPEPSAPQLRVSMPE